MSMTFYASKFFADKGYHGPVFDFADGTVLNLANGNAYFVGETLGMRQSEGMMSLPIDEFIERARAYLESDTPRTAVPTRVDGVPVEEDRVADAMLAPHAGRMRLVEYGLPADYLATKIDFLLELAVAGKAAGATDMLAG